MSTTDGGFAPQPRDHRPLSVIALSMLVACCAVTSARAAVLEAGPGKPFATPSKAIAVAHSGDTVLIAPGTYYDCAIVRQNDITIAGSGPPFSAVLTDKPCAGKALLVIDGRNVTVRNLTLARVRVPAGNGAGIRAEGHNLTVDHVRFVNNQDGILAASEPGSTIIVRDSVFSRNGDCDIRCGHGIDVGRMKLLRVEHSVFQQARGGDHVYTLAQATELIDNQLDDAGRKMAGPLVFVNGGALTLQDNVVTLGPDSRERPGAVLVVGSATAIVVRGNTLHESQGRRVPLLRNWTGRTALASDNTVPADTVAVSDAGSIYHRLRSRLAAFRDSLRAAAHEAKHLVAAVLRRVL